jgi:hypothetical protein
VVDELIRLARDTRASVEARAGAEWGLRRIGRLLQASVQAGPGDSISGTRAQPRHRIACLEPRDQAPVDPGQAEREIAVCSPTGSSGGVRSR